MSFRLRRTRGQAQGSGRQVTRVQEEVDSGTRVDCLLTAENYLWQNGALGPHIDG